MTELTAGGVGTLYLIAFDHRILSWFAWEIIDMLNVYCLFTKILHIRITYLITEIEIPCFEIRIKTSIF